MKEIILFLNIIVLSLSVPTIKAGFYQILQEPKKNRKQSIPLLLIAYVLTIVISYKLNNLAMIVPALIFLIGLGCIKIKVLKKRIIVGVIGVIIAGLLWVHVLYISNNPDVIRSKFGELYELIVILHIFIVLFLFMVFIGGLKGINNIYANHCSPK
jgi:hypothetical protein